MAMSPPKSVLILERAFKKQLRSDAHLFSFVNNNADSFSEDYIKAAELDHIYRDVYQQVCSKFIICDKKDPFFYRGVNLLWCFRKEVFYEAYWLLTRYEILKRLSERYRSIKLTLHKTCSKALCEVVSKTELETEFEIPEIDQNKKIKKRTACSFSPRLITFGQIQGAKVAIFSDFNKSKNLIDELRDQGCVLFANAGSLRTVGRSIVHGVALFQTAYHSDVPPHQVLSAFVDSMKNKNRLNIINHPGLNEILNNRVRFFLEGALNKLLYEVDAMHNFFSSAKSLRSCLLDEDIDASKNAFCQIAKQYSVKTYVELHGAIGAPHGILPLTADYVFVWGKPQRDKLIRWGCQPEKIIVSGCSKYGPYQKTDPRQARKKVLKKLHFNEAQKVALLIFPPISRWHELISRTIMKNITQALDAFAELAHKFEFQMIIKLHPADQNSVFYTDWIKHNHFEKRCVVVKKFDSMLLASGVDFLAVYGSTFAIDGFAMEKPVINLYDETDPLLEEFRSFSTFRYASSKEELIRETTPLLNGTYKKPVDWQRVRHECLNEGSVSPADIITKTLLNSVASTKDAQAKAFSL